jgi:hypothetical protein
MFLLLLVLQPLLVHYTPQWFCEQQTGCFLLRLSDALDATRVVSVIDIKVPPLASTACQQLPSKGKRMKKKFLSMRIDNPLHIHVYLKKGSARISFSLLFQGKGST